MRLVCKLFRLRLVMRAWKAIRQGERLKNAIIFKSKKPIVYCVKYSEYCKCEQCLLEKEEQADIVPQA